MRESVSLAGLRAFVRVAERRSFTDAGRSLYLSESSVSKQIKTLEQGIGVELLVRSKKGLALTEAGKALLPEAEAVLASVERFEKRARLLETAASRLSICHSGTDFESEIIARAGEVLRAQGSPVLLDIGADTTGALFTKLVDGAVEAVIASGRHAPQHPSLIAQSLCEARMVVLAPKGHRLAAKMSVRLQDLEGETLVLPARSTIPIGYDWAIGLLDSALPGGYRVYSVESADYGTIFSAVAAGQGLGLAAPWYRNPLPDHVKYIPIADERACYDLSVLWLGTNDNPNIEQFAKAARAAIESRYPQWAAR